MTARELVAELQEQGVKLTLHGQDIRFKAAKGLHESHLEALRRLKPEVIDLLRRGDDLADTLNWARERLGVDLAACASCQQPLLPGRSYLCQACQDRFPGRATPTAPYLAQDGSLRIPCASPDRFRWWAGGQDPGQTAAELGASREVLARYANPTPGPGIQTASKG